MERRKEKWIGKNVTWREEENMNWREMRGKGIGENKGNRELRKGRKRIGEDEGKYWREGQANQWKQIPNLFIAPLLTEIKGR